MSLVRAVPAQKSTGSGSRRDAREHYAHCMLSGSKLKDFGVQAVEGWRTTHGNTSLLSSTRAHACTLRPKCFAMSLESLPGELLSLVLHQCPFSRLARLALTNRFWAARVASILLARLTNLGCARSRLAAASNFDELEALRLSLDGITMREH